MINSLVERFKGKYPGTIAEKQDSYVLIIFNPGNEEYVLCLNSVAREYLYGKLTSLDEAHLLDCEEIEFSPHGLYLFAKTPEEFIEKIPDKLAKLRFIKSKAH